MKTIKKILCAVDLSDHSKEIASYAVTLAKGLGAEILCVYTAPSLSQYVGFHVPPNTIENFVGEIVTGAEKSMEDFVAEHFADIPTKGHVLVGYAAEEILNRAHEEGVDLIVMGTHGRKGIDRILFGSVAEKVVKNADMPVLTIRPKGVETK
ncbi:MAG: universal stress protein [Desulfovibrio sp.]|jgi:nucleotide-binding universal stress UspA family protein|nr:universal stress protein [Desulfovibrio sp.]